MSERATASEPVVRRYERPSLVKVGKLPTIAAATNITGVR
jgi:hypothetical protein